MALLNKTGIGAGNIIQPSHVTNLYDTFNGTGSFDVIATGSFTGSFRGDGSQLTGIVSSKWTGSNPISRNGDVTVTGEFIAENIEAKNSLYSTKDALTILGGDTTTYIYGPQRITLYASESVRFASDTVRVENTVTAFSLSNLNSGSTAGTGFILPSIRPTAPTTGSMHISGSGGDLSFYVYDGAKWRSGSLG